jgi:hypothetical protein
MCLRHQGWNADLYDGYDLHGKIIMAHNYHKNLRSQTRRLRRLKVYSSSL